MPAASAVRRPAPAPPPASGDRRSRLRPWLRRAALELFDRAWTAGLRPDLARRFDLAPWTVDGLPTPLLESRRWVEALADPERWESMTGVDRRGGYEAAFQAKFRELCQGARLVLDVGAARGLYAALAAASPVGPRVHAFEPDAARRLALRFNLEAVGARGAVVRRDWIGDGFGSTLALDDYCRARGLRPDLIKLDIEGGEVAAIRGLAEACRLARPHLLVELHTRRLRDRLGLDSAELIRLLSAAGYRLRYNGHHGALETGDGEPDLEWRDEPPNDRLVALWASPA